MLSPMKTVTTHYAKTNLSRLLKEVQQSGDIVILSGHVPVGRLVPTSLTQSRRPAVGTATSDKIVIAKDAFAPLDANALKEWGL